MRERKRIPIIRIPAIPAIYFQRNIGMIHADSRLVTEIAIALVERAFIAPDCPPQETAQRTPCRSWHLYLLVKCQIIRLYIEILLAILAVLIFHIF